MKVILESIIKKDYIGQRIIGLLQAMEKSKIDVTLISHPKHFLYFSGIIPGPSPSFLLISEKKIIGISPNPLENITTMTYKDYDIYNGWDAILAARDILGSAIHEFPGTGKTVGFEEKFLPSIFLPILEGFSNRLVDIGKIIWVLRKNKDALEVDQIEHNELINDKVFEKISEFMKPGIKEIELWGEIHKLISILSGGNMVLEADLGGGLRGVDFAAQPTGETLNQNDIVYIDIYSAIRGYYSDTTRTFVLGIPNQKQKLIHSILEDALRIGEHALRPGIPANQVDFVIRKFIADSGYGDNFPHHTGHAFGLFQQERPFIIPGENILIEEGMMIALEPGIYIPDFGGMRLEGNFYIEKNGARRLDHFPSKLIECK